ncbi:hypothetical protein ACVIHF_004464 [Bradyrhizobium sp. USDA 4506]
MAVLLRALASARGYDNWRTGASWDATGLEPGHFSFYLCIIRQPLRPHGGPCAAAERPSSRAQARRVMTVLELAHAVSRNRHEGLTSQ